MPKIVEYVLHRYRARSWTADNGDSNLDKYPGKFYMAEEVDTVLDAMEEKYDFEKRKWQTLEDFYLKEIERLRKNQERDEDGRNS